MQISDHDKQRLQQAATLIEQGKLIEAKISLAELQSTLGESAPVWYLTSFTLDRSEQKLEAIKHALALDPNYEPAKQALNELQLAQVDVNAWFKDGNTAKSTGSLRLVSVLLVVIILLLAGIGSQWVLRNTPTNPDSALLGTQAPTKIPVTQTRTRRPTPTSRPTLTPSPSAFSLALTSGVAEVSLFSAEHEQVGRAAGVFDLKGSSTLTFGDDALHITVIDDATGDTWTFQFYAPDFQANVLYAEAVAYDSNEQGVPRIGIASDQSRCEYQTAGKFIVEQQAPTLILSFTQLCDNLPLRGVLSVTSLLTPPATTAPLTSVSDELGEASAEMTAGSGELSSGERGSISIRGRSKTSFDSGGLAITVTDYATGEGWSFRFDAPGINVNRTYEVANSATTGSDPIEMYVGHSYGNTQLPKCQSPQGNFRIERQGADLIVTFVQQCAEDFRRELKGTLRVRPQTALSPTPTVPADQLYAPLPEISARGNVHIEIVSSSNDPVGGGQGSFTLDGVASINRREYDIFGSYSNKTNVFEIKLDKEPWSFRFWAPSIQLNKPYDVTRNIDQINDRYDRYTLPLGQLPAMTIKNSKYEHNQYQCPNVSGQFTVEQLKPTIIISFTQWCEQDPDKLLQGRLIYTPPLPPTVTQVPTITHTPAPTNTLSPSAEFSKYFHSGLRGAAVDIAWTNTGETYSRPMTQTMMNITKTDLNVRFLTATQPWSFTFYAPTYATGISYESASGFPLKDRTLPAMSIVIKGQECKDPNGNFKFETFGADAIITFTQICPSDPTLSVRGVINYLSYPSYMATNRAKK